MRCVDCSPNEDVPLPLAVAFILSPSRGVGLFGNCVATNCTARSNSNHGILPANDRGITACTSTRNGFDGTRVDSACRVAENTCDENGRRGLFAGIFASGFYNRIEGNHTNTNDTAISTRREHWEHHHPQHRCRQHDQ